MDPATLAALGTVATIALEVGLNFLLAAAQYLIEALFKIITYLFNTVVLSILTIYSGFLGPLAIGANTVLNDFKSAKFDGTPIVKERYSGTMDIFGYATMVFEEIRMIILDALPVIVSILILGFPLIPIYLFVIGIVALLWGLSPLAFAIVQVAYSTWIIFEHWLVYWLNVWMSVGEASGGLINYNWRLIVSVFVTLFKLVCSTTPATGDILVDCPLVNILYMVLVVNWDFWWGFAEFSWEIAELTWETIGNFLCPTVCDPQLCLRFLSRESCRWTPDFAVAFIFGTIYDFIIILAIPLRIMLYFVIVSVNLLLSRFYFLVVRFIPGTLGAALSRLGTTFAGTANQLASMVVPVQYQEFLEITVFIYTVIDVVSKLIAETAVFFGAIFDLFGCYLFRDPWYCGVAKICFTAVFNVKIGEIVWNWRQWICVDSLHFELEGCAKTCEKCGILLFNLPAVGAKIFFAESNKYWLNDPNAEVIRVPCNVVTLCCSKEYSMFTSYIPGLF